MLLHAVGMQPINNRIATISIATALLCSRRTNLNLTFGNAFQWYLPFDAKKMKVTKEELEQIKYFPNRHKERWEYNRIDDKINAESEFRKTEGRETFFQGLREDSEIIKTGSLHTPRHYRLYKYFDEYTKPGVDSKVAAAFAVREQWNADQFYYPGEAYKRNRPGFRSVPKELLNRQTWYKWSDFIVKLDEIQTTQRPRAQNPDWPPPGYRMPKFETRRLYEFGNNDPVLTNEVYRYVWFKNWEVMNVRYGITEYIVLVLFILFNYIVLKQLNSLVAYHSAVGGTYYPGRDYIRPSGVPKDITKEPGWWQLPLEKFPCQLTIWYLSQIRFGYINYIKRRDAQEKALQEAEVHSEKDNVI